MTTTRKEQLIKKADLAKLLFTHLFIRRALEFFRPGLVDDMGDLLFGELATELVFLTFDGHVPLLRPLREPFNKLGLDTLDLETIGGFPNLITELWSRLASSLR